MSNITLHRQAMREVDYQIRSNRPLIYIVTHEESRVFDALKAVCSRGDNIKWDLLTWDCAAGIDSFTDKFVLPSDKNLDAGGVLEWFMEQDDRDEQYLVLVLKDFHKYLGADGHPGEFEHRMVRSLRNFCDRGRGSHKTLIITGTKLALPEDLEKDCAVVDWPFPEKEHIRSCVETMLKAAVKNNALSAKFTTDYSEEEMDEVSRAFLGLTLGECELLTTYSMLTADRMDPRLISSHKKDIIRKAGLVEWIDVDVDLAQVGGLKGVKDWVGKREDAFGQKARDYGLPYPKGLLFIGPAGTGKSQICKGIAHKWGLPLLRIDIGKLFGSLVGESEENIRNAIKLAEATAPCLLWCDELEKGFSGVSGGGQSDSGTSARVFATFLTWMQEHQTPVFLAATANDVSALPPELLRKGRFDDIFFVDLPELEDRQDIFSIHINKRKRDATTYDLVALAKASESFTGAEIEGAVMSAMYEAFDDGREFDTNDILDAVGETIPLAVMMKERILELREWAKLRARSAATLQHPSKGRKAKHGIVRAIEDREL